MVVRHWVALEMLVSEQNGTQRRHRLPGSGSSRLLPCRCSVEWRLPSPSFPCGRHRRDCPELAFHFPPLAVPLVSARVTYGSRHPPRSPDTSSSTPPG